MIKLSDFPHSSGVYWFISNNEIIYVGSSCNLYDRIRYHKKCIKKGFCECHSTDLYQFLQSNSFTIEFQLSDNYKQLEQKLIEKYQPKYNCHKAFTGLGAKTGREAEYMKEYDKKYQNQLCNYNGEVLKLNALRMRLMRRGIEHPTIEAKKYLIK